MDQRRGQTHHAPRVGVYPVGHLQTGHGEVHGAEITLMGREYDHRAASDGIGYEPGTVLLSSGQSCEEVADTHAT
jgi:hypothetical protein